MINMKRCIYFTAVIMTCLLGITCLSSCLNNDEDVDVVKNVILEVDSHPCAVYPIPSGIIELPLPGMKIKEENSKEWQDESQYAIEGFTFEPGYFYTVKVKKTILANPPADSGNVRYKLIEVLKKEKDPLYIPAEGKLVGRWSEEYTDSEANSDKHIIYNFEGSEFSGTLTIITYTPSDPDGKEHIENGIYGVDGKKLTLLVGKEGTPLTYCIEKLTSHEMEWQKNGTTFSPETVGMDYKHFYKVINE